MVQLRVPAPFLNINMKKIAITVGDPTGIGPEIVIKTLKKYQFPVTLVIYGSITGEIKLPNLKNITTVDEIDKDDNTLFWIQVTKGHLFTPGQPSHESGLAAYEALQMACSDALIGEVDAIVTAPVSKHFIQLSYPDFIGQTEFFAKMSNTEDVVMSFFSDKLVAGLLTTHCSLSEVASSLTKDMICKKIEIINTSLQRYFKILKPELALLGINPHAGEEGAFGSEEQRVMIPAIAQSQKMGIKITGPFPADTFFAGNYKKYDMIISAYHDQVLIPFKMLSFDEGVNVTLGLPFIRASVDHGTAFDIAGKGIASEKSLVAAINLAIKMSS